MLLNWRSFFSVSFFKSIYPYNYSYRHKYFSTFIQPEQIYKINPKPGDILTGVPITAINWECEGVCYVEFPELDSSMVLNNDIFFRLKDDLKGTKPIKQIYDFHALNNYAPKPFYLDENQFIASVFNLESNNCIDNTQNNQHQITSVQEYSFLDTLPGDILVLRVDSTNNSLTMEEKQLASLQQLTSAPHPEIVLSNLGTTIQSSDTVTPNCSFFEKGCSGCKIQHLHMRAQLKEKTNLIKRLIASSYSISQKEQQIKMDFLEDCHRLKLMNEYNADNVREINARYEYDLDQYKDPIFLEQACLTSDEINIKVKDIISDYQSYNFSTCSVFELIRDKKNVPKIGYEYSHMPSVFLMPTRCSLLHSFTRDTINNVLKALQIHRDDILTACSKRMTGHIKSVRIVINEQSDHMQKTMHHLKWEVLINFTIIQFPSIHAFQLFANTIQTLSPNCIGITVDIHLPYNPILLREYCALLYGKPIITTHLKEKCVQSSAMEHARIRPMSYNVFKQMCNELDHLIDSIVIQIKTNDQLCHIWDINCGEGLSTQLVCQNKKIDQIVAITSSVQGVRVIQESIGNLPSCIQDYTAIILASIENDDTLNDVLNHVSTIREHHTLNKIAHQHSDLNAYFISKEPTEFIHRVNDNRTNNHIIDTDLDTASTNNCNWNDWLSVEELIENERQWAITNNPLLIDKLFKHVYDKPISMNRHSIELKTASIIILHHWKEHQYTKEWFSIILNTLLLKKPHILYISSSPKFAEDNIRHIRRSGYSIATVSIYDGQLHTSDMKIIIHFYPS